MMIQTDTYNEDLVEIVKNSANSIANIKKNNKVDKISESTKAMLKKRREIKENATKFGKIEYGELL